MGEITGKSPGDEKYVDRLRYAIKATSDIVWEWNIKEGILYKGQGFKELIGDKGSFDINLFEACIERVHPDDKKRLTEKIRTCLNNPNCSKWKSMYKYKTGGDDYAHVLDRACILRDAAGTATRMIGVMQNVTHLKVKEERTQKFQEVIASLGADKSLPEKEFADALPKVLQISAKTLQIARASIWLLEEDTLQSIFSYDETENETFTFQQIPLFIEEVRKNRTFAAVNVLKDKFPPRLIESYFKPHNIHSFLKTSTKTGNIRAVVCHETVGEERDWKQDEIAFADAITDQIAQLLEHKEKETREKQIRQSLREKDVLLTEVHHRIKNNLAVISGMVQLQAHEEKDEAIRSKFMDLVNRIGSIANIHEQLYQTEHFTELKFAENIQNLVSQIVKTLNSSDIDVHFNLKPLKLNINQAIPCSLIVNEVITNIVKHAFSGREKGVIEVILYEKEQQIYLIIKDNGKGLPDDFDVTGPHESLGMDLINTLANQLSADYKYLPAEKGTEFLLQFKKAKLTESSIQT